MYQGASRPTTPFVPPHPDLSPSVQPPVIPTPPTNSAYLGAWGATPAASAAPLPAGAWPGSGTPYPGRGRRNSYQGMPVGGGPPFDQGAYFGYPAAAYPTATPASSARGLGGDPWADQQFLAPSYQHTPVIPPRPSRSHSRGSSNGLPPDWAGPTRPGEPFVVPQSMPIPPEFVGRVPPGTPWYPPAVVPGTGYSNFQHPLPPAGVIPPRPAGHHRRASHSSHSQHATPWHGWGYLPPSPGAEEILYDPFDRIDRAARPEHGTGMVDTRWFEKGKGYGPVLDPLLAGIVKCTFKVNPLLAPPPDDPAKRPYLTWNMLFHSAYVHRSDEPAHHSWQNGRKAPATFPHLSSMRIISKSFPWFIEVKAESSSRGVTCGDIIEALFRFFEERTSQKEYQLLPQVQQSKVAMSYYHNRSMADDVPGGRLGQGMRRSDYLCEETMWGGLEVDQRYVAERMAINLGAKREANNVFVLNCEKRLPRTQDERREEAARGRSASRARDNSE